MRLTVTDTGVGMTADVESLAGSPTRTGTSPSSPLYRGRCMESGIETAYGQEPDGQVLGCSPCSVTWFGTDRCCWVCGRPADGPAVIVPSNGSESWCAARCVDVADQEETAAFLRHVLAEGVAP